MKVWRRWLSLCKVLEYCNSGAVSSNPGTHGKLFKCRNFGFVASEAQHFQALGAAFLHQAVWEGSQQTSLWETPFPQILACSISWQFRQKTILVKHFTFSKPVSLGRKQKLCRQPFLDSAREEGGLQTAPGCQQYSAVALELENSLPSSPVPSHML